MLCAETKQSEREREKNRGEIKKEKRELVVVVVIVVVVPLSSSLGAHPSAKRHVFKLAIIYKAALQKS